jgi:ketosteroid isomerase-like protein
MHDAPIEQFFEMYAERYMASDVDAIAALYEAPFLAVREGRAIHLGDRDAVREHLIALMEAYRSSGAARATIGDLRVTQLDRTSAIATVRWNVLADDGALLRDFATSYQMLREEPGGWRILSYTYHDE